MNGVVLEKWQFRAEERLSVPVVPDGCRDLICINFGEERPSWLVSNLDETTRLVAVDRGFEITGYRLRPGTRIPVAGLISSIGETDPNDGGINEIIENMCSLDSSVDEALGCIGSLSGNINDAAKVIGVRVRTLQRLLQKHTAHPPVFWLRLARARRAAKSISQGSSLAEAAYNAGYCDQSHMNREFRKWFGTTPSGFINDAVQASMIFDKGFA